MWERGRNNRRKHRSRHDRRSERKRDPQKREVATRVVRFRKARPVGKATRQLRSRSYQGRCNPRKTVGEKARSKKKIEGKASPKF